VLHFVYTFVTVVLHLFNFFCHPRVPLCSVFCECLQQLLFEHERNVIQFIHSACKQLHISINQPIVVDGCGVVLSDPFRGIGELRRDPTVEPRPKVWTIGQIWKKLYQRYRAGEAHMRNNPEGGELDPVDDVRRRCKENSPVLSCIGKRTREGCDHGIEVGTTVGSPWNSSTPPSLGRGRVAPPPSLDSSQRTKRGRASSSEKIEGIWQKREL